MDNGDRSSPPLSTFTLSSHRRTVDLKRRSRGNAARRLCSRDGNSSVLPACCLINDLNPNTHSQLMSAVSHVVMGDIISPKGFCRLCWASAYCITPCTAVALIFFSLYYYRWCIDARHPHRHFECRVLELQKYSNCSIMFFYPVANLSCCFLPCQKFWTLI